MQSFEDICVHIPISDFSLQVIFQFEFLSKNALVNAYVLILV